MLCVSVRIWEHLNIFKPHESSSQLSTHIILVQPFITSLIPFIMQNDYAADSDSGESDNHQSLNAQPTDTGFLITPDDTGILYTYLKQFKSSDTSHHATLIEEAMAQLYQLHPDNASFDKMEARKACCLYVLM